MRFFCLCILTFASITFGSNAFAENTPLWKKVGLWDVRVDQSLGNGCFLVLDFDNGTIFRLGFNPLNDNAYIMIGNIDWRSIEHGKEYNIKIQFDDALPWTGTATGTEMSADLTMLLQVVDETEFLLEFMRKNILAVYYQGNVITRISLRGSYAAGTELLNCQTKFRDYDKRNKTTDPFSSQSKKKDPFSS